MPGTGGPMNLWSWDGPKFTGLMSFTVMACPEGTINGGISVMIARSDSYFEEH